MVHQIFIPRHRIVTELFPFVFNRCIMICDDADVSKYDRVIFLVYIDVCSFSLACYITCIYVYIVTLKFWDNAGSQHKKNNDNDDKRMLIKHKEII